MKDSNREVKWFLGVVIVLLIAAVIGSIYISRTGEAAAKNEAIENAFEEAKRDMAEEYDAVLVEHIEIQELIEVTGQRDEATYEVILSWPRLSDIYDHLYEEVIQQEVWEADSIEDAVNQIYVEALNSAGRENMVLPVEIRLAKQDRGTWQAENPEGFFFVIPRNPTTYIIEDMERMTELMGFTVDTDELPQGSLEKKVVETLNEKGLYQDFDFHYSKGSEGNIYRLNMRVNGFYTEEDINTLTMEKTYREHRGEIHSQEELMSIVLDKMEDRATRNTTVHSLELMEYERPTDDHFGYELRYRSGYAVDLIYDFVDTGGNFEVSGLELESLKRYYLSQQIDNIMDRIEPRWMKEFSDINPLNVKVYDDEIALLSSGNQELIFQTYDFETGTLIDETVLAEEYPMILFSELEEFSDYEIDKHENYYVVTDKSVMEEIWVVEQGQDELIVHPPVSYETDPEFADYNLEVLLYNEMVHTVITHEEDRLQQNFTVTVENHTENTREEVVFFEGKSGDHFLSRKHGVMLVYSEINTVEEEETPEAFIGIYDFEEETVIDLEQIPEELREVRIDQVEPIDEDRLLIVTEDRDLWELHLEERSFHKSDLMEMVGLTYDLDQLGQYGGTREAFRFYPMKQGYYFLEILGLSPRGILRERSLILKDDDEALLQPVLDLSHRKDQGSIVLTYLKKNDLLMMVEETYGEEQRETEISLMEISYEALDNIEKWIESSSIEDLISESYVEELGTYVEIRDAKEMSFFPLDMQGYSPESLGASKGSVYFNRETQDLLIENSTFGQFSRRNYVRHFNFANNIGDTLPLWNYDDLYMNQENYSIYYRDERGMLVFDLEEFIAALIQGN